MLNLKSEIEQYLLENHFSLVDDVISSDTMFVYKSTKYKYCTVTISSEPSFKNYVVFYMEYIMDNDRATNIDRMILKSLDECKFLMTHCMRSALFDVELIK